MPDVGIQLSWCHMSDHTVTQLWGSCSFLYIHVPCCISVTNTTKKSSSYKTNKSSTTQGILHIMMNLEIHCHIHNSRQPVPILRQIDPVLATSSHFLKIHFNIILPSMPRSSKWLFLSGFPTKTLYATLLSPIHATYTIDLSFLDFFTWIIFDEKQQPCYSYIVKMFWSPNFKLLTNVFQHIASNI